MDELFEKQRREQEVKSKLKNIGIRQNELKLMKAARRTNVHGDALAKESTRKLLRGVMRVFLHLGFPENSIRTITSFLPLYAWKDDLDAFAETMYLTVEFPDNDFFNPNIKCLQLQRTEMFGPSSDGEWRSVDCTWKITLTRHEFTIQGINFGSEEGFIPNRKTDFLSRYSYRKAKHQGNVRFFEHEHKLIKVFVSPCKILPDQIAVE